MSKVYGVVFNGLNKKYYYESEEDLALDTLVIVNTERGLQLVKVAEILDKKLEENTKMVNSNFEEIAKISDTNLEENCIP